MKKSVVAVLMLGMTMALDADTNKYVWIDDENGLMWQDNTATRSLKMNWYEAQEYCRDLRVGGYKDWKLPSKSQLDTLYMSKGKLKNVGAYYWSSSIDVGDSDLARGANFGNGARFDSDLKSARDHVRCVRDSQ